MDGFAQEGTAKCPRWWGPGSPHGEDAFSQSWNGENLWLNPPFSLLDRLVQKIRDDQAHAILVIPEWRLSKFFKPPSNLRRADLLWLKGTKFFFA